MLDRAKRLGMYAFWSSAGFAIAVAIDRLVVCPVLATHLGKETFGAFVWVLGVVNLFGNVAANGFTLKLMRDHASHEPEDARNMLRTALLLSLAVAFVVLGLTAVVSYSLADTVVRLHAAAMYIPLIAQAAIRVGATVLLAEFRIRRRFKAVFCLKVIEAVALLGALLVASSRNLWAIGFVYLLSVLVPFGLGLVWCPAARGRGPWVTLSAARSLMSAWSGGALIGLTEQIQVYASRIVLGALVTADQVAVLYAGTSMGNTFVMPVGMLGMLVLSLLGSKTTFVFGGRIGRYYWLGCIGLGACVGVLSYGIGRWMVGALYPEFASETLRFYHWIAVSNAFVASSMLLRPVAVKYLPIRRINVLSATSAMIHVALLAVMIPAAGARGAAAAMAMSSAVAFLLWSAHYRAMRRELSARESA